MSQSNSDAPEQLRYGFEPEELYLSGSLTPVELIYADDGLASLYAADLLTGAESWVLALGAIGCTVEETASRILYAPDTVKTFRASLFEKLGAVSIENSVYISFEKGLFVVEQPVTTMRNLSSREMQILTMSARGLSKEQIAKEMDISFHTVDQHVENLEDKLKAPNIANAVFMTYLSGQA